MAAHGCILCSKCGSGCPLCGRCTCTPEEPKSYWNDINDRIAREIDEQVLAEIQNDIRLKPETD